MKKFYIGLLVCLSLVFTGCSALQELNNFLDDVMKTAGISKEDSTLGNHHGILYLNKRPAYYESSPFEVITSNNDQYSNSFKVRGAFLNTSNENLTVVCHIPIYNKNGKNLTTKTYEYLSRPGKSSETITVNDSYKSKSDDYPYVSIDKIIIFVFDSKQNLIGSNNSEVMRKYIESRNAASNKTKTVNKNTYKPKSVTKPKTTKPAGQQRQQPAPQIPGKRQTIK